MINDNILCQKSRTLGLHKEQLQMPINAFKSMNKQMEQRIQ